MKCHYWQDVVRERSGPLDQVLEACRIHIERGWILQMCRELRYESGFGIEMVNQGRDGGPALMRRHPSSLAERCALAHKRERRKLDMIR